MLKLEPNSAGAAFICHPTPQCEEEDDWQDCPAPPADNQDAISQVDSGIFAQPASETTSGQGATVLELGVNHVTPGQLQAWQQALLAETGRPVDCILAADVIARVQQKTCPPPGGKPLSLEQRIKAVSETDVRDFMRATGLSQRDREQGAASQAKAAALASLATLPAALFGTCLSSTVNAIFPDNATARLIGFVLNTATLLASPYINAWLLQPFGAKADQWRAEHYVVRVDRTRMNDGFSKADISARIRTRIAEFDAAYMDMQRWLHSADRLNQLQANQFAAANNRFQRAANALERLLPDINAKTAADQRVYLDNAFQQIARYPKAVLAPFGQLLRGARLISAWVSAALQMGASVGTAAVQAWLAGRDEYRKQQYTIKHHMLEGAPLTDEGRRRAARRRPIRPRDIDETRLRDFFTGPARARAAMLATGLRAHAGRQETLTAGAVADAVGNAAAADAARAELADLRADLDRVEGLRLDELALDGVAARLLAPGRFTDPLLRAEISARLLKRGEVSTQFCKFMGQQWQLAVGPGYYVFVPKLLNVLAHGKPPLAGNATMLGLSVLFSMAGCCAFPEVAIERNEMQVRIDEAGVGPGFLDLVRDAGITLIALPRQWVQKREFGRSVDAVLDRLGHRNVVNLQLRDFRREHLRPVVADDEYFDAES